MNILTVKTLIDQGIELNATVNEVKNNKYTILFSNNKKEEQQPFLLVSSLKKIRYFSRIDSAILLLIDLGFKTIQLNCKPTKKRR